MILKNRKIFFFIDYSDTIGVGHYSRSSLIAKELKKKNLIVKILKINKSNKFEICDFNKFLHEKNILPKSKIINRKILKFINYHKVKTVVLDTLNQNKSLINLLENNNIKTISFLSSPRENSYSSINVSFSPYNNLFNYNKANHYLGVSYILFKKNFISYRKFKIRNITKIKKVTVILGGSVNHDYFKIIINKIIIFCNKINFRIFFYSRNASFIKINKYLKEKKITNVKIIVNSKNIAKEFYYSDLIITSGGYSSFEASFLKKPFVTIQMSKNQKYNCIAFEKLGASINLGDIKKNNKMLPKSFEKIIYNTDLLIKMTKNSKKIFKYWHNEKLINSIVEKIR